ncbi:cystathionine gamma-lyase, partial [Aphelenchoides avenae]
TQAALRDLIAPYHSVEVDLVKPDAIEQSLKENTRIVWFETPANPTLEVIDIAATVDAVKRFNKHIRVVVDNTFMTPYFQQPLSFGADVVIHSLSKYINGHTDVLMGAVITNNAELDRKLFVYQKIAGSVPSSFDCYLVQRGILTLHMRMDRHMHNALAVAKWLEKHPKVERVLYPELESHPQHAIHKKQTRGMSGMVSFYISGGAEEANKFLMKLKVFFMASSLGSIESLASTPYTMGHKLQPGEGHPPGITPNLIRLSVGCEDANDLIADLDQALM